MGTFAFQDIYEEDNQKVLELDILRDNHCNLDCVFCPIGGTTFKGDRPLSLAGSMSAFEELKTMLNENDVDVVYFNSNGESFINDKFEEIVDYIKSKGIKVRLFSNGYMLGMPEYIEMANKCDEVFGEIKCATEETFQKYQRPVEGYSLVQYVDNMSSFKNQFNGKFHLIATVLQGYNDDEASVSWLKETIEKINPDVLTVETLTDDVYGKAFGIDEERLNQIKALLS